MNILIIDREEKQKIINTWANENIFLKGYSVVPRVFLGIPVYIATVYLSGTEEPSPWWGYLSVKVLEFRVSRLALNAFPSLV